ncbi:MAG: hypothetical protein V1875_10460 [Candidatus Altiarchaeota archaeon]
MNRRNVAIALTILFIFAIVGGGVFKDPVLFTFALSIPASAIIWYAVSEVSNEKARIWISAVYGLVGQGIMFICSGMFCPNCFARCLFYNPFTPFFLPSVLTAILWVDFLNYTLRDVYGGILVAAFLFLYFTFNAVNWMLPSFFIKYIKRRGA